MSKKRRLHRIFKEDGKALIVAMDHGNGMNVLPELKNPGNIIKQIVTGGADALLTTYGIINSFEEQLLDVGLILRGDLGTSDLGKRDKPMEIVYTAENALRIGADAILCMGFPGSAFEDISLKELAKLVASAKEWGLPIGAEMLPRGFEGGEDSRSPQNIALACRIGCELGVDFVKTQYTGDVDSFKEIVDSCYKPIVILGGGKMNNDRELLSTVKDAIDSGAKGIAFGRNIWRHKNPYGITKALNMLIHENRTIEECLKVVEANKYE